MTLINSLSVTRTNKYINFVTHLFEASFLASCSDYEKQFK